MGFIVFLNYVLISLLLLLMLFPGLLTEYVFSTLLMRDISISILLCQGSKNFPHSPGLCMESCELVFWYLLRKLNLI